MKIKSICNQYFAYDYVSRKYFRHSFYHNNLLIAIPAYNLISQSLKSTSLFYYASLINMGYIKTEYKNRSVKCLLRI